MNYLILFMEFFKTGLFAIGGGMATLPFLYELVKYGWYSMPELMDMIAVAESTPGPIGVNMATYAGFRAGSFLGGITATIGLVLPSLLVVMLVYKILEKFKNSPVVENAFYGLRPAVAGLIIVASAELFRLTVLKADFNVLSWNFIELKPAILFVVLTVCVFLWKKVHPILFIIAGAVAGILLGM